MNECHGQRAQLRDTESVEKRETRTRKSNNERAARKEGRRCREIAVDQRGTGLIRMLIHGPTPVLYSYAFDMMESITPYATQTPCWTKQGSRSLEALRPDQDDLELSRPQPFQQLATLILPAETTLTGERGSSMRHASEV